jgi:imidazolonepropionase-like amidohydrolase
VVPDDGSGERDVYVRDGRVTFEAVADATTVTHGRCFLMPGLVDMHSHVGLAKGGAVDRPTTAAQALAERDAGVLLIRDAGSAADTRWLDQREDMPRMVRAGRHIARTRRYIPGYAHEIEPDRLVALVRQEAHRGDGWVKIVGDWIDRSVGDLAPCWPEGVLREAIAAAHEAGARITAHVFGEEALPALVAAGIDCIEHATGLRSVDEGGLREEMARRAVVVVPTLINIDNFPTYAAAGQAKFPTYARHMRDLHRGSRVNVAEAFEAGIPILAGTDAGGTVSHGLIAQEVLALHAAGIPAADAVAAASWRAREYLLGEPGILVEGAPADLVVLERDPLRHPETLLDPLLVVLRGAMVPR